MKHFNNGQTVYSQTHELGLFEGVVENQIENIVAVKVGEKQLEFSENVLFETREEAVEYTKNKKCDCKICVRYRAYKKYIESVKDAEARKFFDTLFSHIYNIEEDLELETIYQSNLKKMYPKIYNEMHTLVPLIPGTEKHPEINI